MKSRLKFKKTYILGVPYILGVRHCIFTAFKCFVLFVNGYKKHFSTSLFLFGLITLKNFSLITSYTLDIQLSGFGHNLYPLIVLLVLFFDSTLKLTQREKICKQYCNIFFHKYGCFLFLIFLTSFSPFMINNSFFYAFPCMV